MQSTNLRPANQLANRTGPNDGDLDLYVANFNSANILYRNNTNGTFGNGTVYGVLYNTDGTTPYTTAARTIGLSINGATLYSTFIKESASLSLPLVL